MNRNQQLAKSAGQLNQLGRVTFGLVDELDQNKNKRAMPDQLRHDPYFRPSPFRCWPINRTISWSALDMEVRRDDCSAVSPFVQEV
jgi:hypothetical protein